ncbi:hypothetical protein JG688_00009167 [Phytophthora aleatoria]|uniref:Uncharacterized protein n=1 Tax=Phytophthora aleatoria TaxID=2496075 RepID=A0A8J5MFH8_9STRA|nr:hypothetical protein JG688_00009167 [Phytophthora aleatoria]
MVEATVVVKLAIDTASALTARLQLRYPALKTAEDVAVIVMENAPKDYMKKMANAVTDFCMLIMDFMSVGSTLASFTSAIPTRARTKLVLRDGFFGETYGEERTPQYVPPDPSNMVFSCCSSCRCYITRSSRQRLLRAPDTIHPGWSALLWHRWMNTSRRGRLQCLLCLRASAGLSLLLHSKGILDSLAT